MASETTVYTPGIKAGLETLAAALSNVVSGDQVISLLTELNRKVEIIMADTQATLAALAAANASLDGIQADITALKALVDAGATPQEVADAVNALAAKAAGIDSQT
jgi:hypothetical protein